MITLLVGAVAGFFLAGPLVFADGPMSERIVGLGILAVAYLVLGALAGYTLQTWTVGLWLGAPGVVVAFGLGGDSPLLIALTAGTLLAGGVAGAAAGAHWRRRRGKPA